MGIMQGTWPRVDNCYIYPSIKIDTAMERVVGAQILIRMSPSGAARNPSDT